MCSENGLFRGMFAVLSFAIWKEPTWFCYLDVRNIILMFPQS